jgi:hypothetical protein
MHLTIHESAAAHCAASVVPFTGSQAGCSRMRLVRQMRMRTIVLAEGSTEGGTLAHWSRSVTMHQDA